MDTFAKTLIINFVLVAAHSCYPDIVCRLFVCQLSCPQTSSGSKFKAWKLTAKRELKGVRILLVKTGAILFSNSSVITALPSLYVLQRTVFPDFLIRLRLKSGFFCFKKHISHKGGKFETLALNIGCLGAEIYVRNNQSIPINNYYW